VCTKIYPFDKIPRLCFCCFFGRRPADFPLTSAKINSKEMNIGSSLVILTLIACLIDTLEELPLKVEVCSIARWQEVLEKDMSE
jgi:hypothetical protein